MALFFNVILPIIAVFAAGFVLQRIRVLDVKSVSAVTLYILSPAMVFTGLYEAEFNSGYIVIIVFMFVLLFFMIIVNKILAKSLKWSPNVESASILATGFMNSGNYGLPVVLSTLGPQSMSYAVFIMVIQGLQNNFFGIYYASRGTSGMKRALINVMKMPVTYAAVLAFIFQLFAWEIPTPIYSTITMVGNAAIPVMMIMLGMQLGSMIKVKWNWQVISIATILKMVIAPAFAFLFVLVFNVDPLVAGVLIIISAMPTAATTTMYAIEFDTEPELVSSITFVATVASVFTLSILLNLLS